MGTGPERASVLVLGIGNLLLRDEGIGVHVVRAMAKAPLPDDVEVVDGGTAGADLLDVIADRRKVVVVDALDADVPPGTILRMKPEDALVNAPDAVSLHELGIADTLRMATQLNCSPEDVTIIAIKPKDVRCGLELSPEMDRWMPRLVTAVIEEIAP